MSVLASILIPIAAKAGAPLLKSLLEEALPDGAVKTVANSIVNALSAALGVPATPEAIAEAYEKDPLKTAETIRQVEAELGPEWVSEAIKGRDALLAREDAKSFFYNGWRPAMSWLQIWLWIWNAVLLPLLNIAFQTTLPAVPYEQLIAFGGLWLVIYGGGHTIKSIFGKGEG